MIRQKAGLFVLIGAVGCSPVLAQQEDEQTRDHATQDQSYYERYRKPADEPEPEEQQDPREAFLARAEEAVRDKNYRSWDSETNRVQTDDPRIDPKAAVLLLDKFREFFNGFWSDAIELYDFDDQSRTFLFWSYHKFNKIAEGDWAMADQRPTGHYRRQFDAMTIHTDSDSIGAHSDLLVHEASHQLVAHRIYGPAGRSSLWIGEGLGSYFGYTYQDESLEFQRGEVGGKAIAFVRGSRPTPGGEAKFRLKELKQARGQWSRDEDGPRLTDVLFMNDAGQFYGKNAGLNYSASWVIIHYLLHGDDGRHAQTFERFVVLEREGRGGGEVLLQSLDMTEEELDAAVGAHLKKMRAR